MIDDVKWELSNFGDDDGLSMIITIRKQSNIHEILKKENLWFLIKLFKNKNNLLQ